MQTKYSLLRFGTLALTCAAVDDVTAWCILAVAIAGKYIGTYVAARVSGIKKREASALGWLMNRL